MGFEGFPPENELIRFFEVEPEVFGDTVITYKRDCNGETLYCSFSPDYGDIDLTLRWSGTMRWSRNGGQKKDVYFFCDDSKKERNVARQTA